MCCFARVLNSSACLQLCVLDLFWVFLLQACLLLPLCFHYCLLPFDFREECLLLLLPPPSPLCSLSKALHFLCNFFWRYCRLIQPASLTALKNRNFQPAPHPPLDHSLYHYAIPFIHRHQNRASVSSVVFSLLLVLGRFKE